MVQKLNDFTSRLLRSPRFFYAVVALLVFQAAWIALTARYPQAFDENYHFGLIQLHAQQWMPFFTHQPPGTAVHGAISRDPSYLYHFLMSFPYRLLTLVTDSVTLQIIVLRFLNIAMFVAGLFAFRRLFAELGISTAISNVVLLFLVLLPVVPLLAGQINYDNLMFYLTGLLFLIVVRYIDAIRQAALAHGPFPLLLALQILTIGGFGSLVKFPFVPIFLGVVILAGFMTWRLMSQAHDQNHRLLHTLPAKNLQLLLWTFAALLVLILCVERYGLNLARYHSPVPKCDKVLSIAECQQYSPWARDYMFASTYPSPTPKGIMVYPPVWVHRTVYETMFTITSYIYEPWGTVTYLPYPPLTIANYTAWTFVTIGVAAAIRYWRHIRDTTGMLVLLAVSAFYMAVLFLQNFAMYMHTGEAVAIHGRYLVPIYPILMLAAVIGLNSFFMEFMHGSVRRYRGLLAIIALALLLQGGGIVVWIVRSDPSWYWLQSHPAAQANWYAKDVLYRVVHH